ncbi:MAG TPA: GNAT family N-acetyltransferase [Anaerolineaceae bacterium]|nr:GNAT family N-acetyltransferase [Anaerolineaceae bacterium]
MEQKAGERAGNIRSINPRTDLREIADLIELCFKDTLDEDGLDYIRYLRKLASNFNEFSWGGESSFSSIARIQGFIYEVDGKIVGNLSMIPFHKNGEFIYLVANVAVHPLHRRKKIALDLTAKSIKYAKEKSAESIWLQVRDDNPPAITLYRQMGFVEKYRRSTFTIPGTVSLKEYKGYGITISQRGNEEWDQHKSWLNDNYPDDIRWNVGLRDNRLLPGFWNALSRFFSGVSVKNLSVFKNQQLIGIASLEKTNLYADNLWIACPEENDDEVVRASIPYFRSSRIFIRPQTINYPVDRGEKAFEDLGFKKNHTLIWMEEKLNARSFVSEM